MRDAFSPEGRESGSSFFAPCAEERLRATMSDAKTGGLTAVYN